MIIINELAEFLKKKRGRHPERPRRHGTPGYVGRLGTARQAATWHPRAAPPAPLPSSLPTA
jgi:hypothetical protein